MQPTIAPEDTDHPAEVSHAECERLLRYYRWTGPARGLPLSYRTPVYRERRDHLTKRPRVAPEALVVRRAPTMRVWPGAALGKELNCWGCLTCRCWPELSDGECEGNSLARKRNAPLVRAVDGLRLIGATRPEKESPWKTDADDDG
jgi:hypothetical protein